MDWLFSCMYRMICVPAWTDQNFWFLTELGEKHWRQKRVRWMQLRCFFSSELHLWPPTEDWVLKLDEDPPPWPWDACPFCKYFSNSRIRDQGSQIKDEGSGITNQGSRIKDRGWQWSSLWRSVNFILHLAHAATLTLKHISMKYLWNVFEMFAFSEHGCHHDSIKESWSLNWTTFNVDSTLCRENLDTAGEGGWSAIWLLHRRLGRINSDVVLWYVSLVMDWIFSRMIRRDHI